MSDYDVSFFDENLRVGLSAAKVIMPWVLQKTGAQSVIDIGCGSTAWLSIASKLGCIVRGVDGYVPDGKLLIDESEFTRQDLTAGVSCDGYDLAMCLEVAEHLPESSAADLVNGLCEAKYVFWSAAVPGQRGVNHINERWSSWWEPYFNANGYIGSCDIRRVFWEDISIATFYRQNIMIWAKPDDLFAIGLTENVLDEIHPEHTHIPPPWHL